MSASVLAQHLGPTHHLELLDERRLKCHTCSRTLLLPSPAASTSPTSNPPHPPVDQQCPTHRGEPRHACRCCRADALEHGTERSQHALVRLPATA